MQMKELTSEEQELVRQHRAKQEKKKWVPTDSSYIDPQHKIAAFDSLYDLAVDLWKYGSDDEEHRCYEAVMELLDIDREDNEPSIWDRINGKV